MIRGYFPGYFYKKESMQTYRQLSRKYDVSVPRYTSYPTVPSWKEGIDAEAWKTGFTRQFLRGNKEDGISLYIHLPFCESLCIYCGCTKRITHNHSVEEEYIDAVLAEWRLYVDLMAEAPVIREIHLGGGTPTFFSPANLAKLVNGVLKNAVLHPGFEGSLEGHPNNTTREHLDVLYGLGFRRVSLGVQDTNIEVQQLIHRIQPFENVRRVTDEARAAGFTSINFDLIYGLPGQDADRLVHTIRQSLSLSPDRLAFYSYAHIPGVSCNQRLIDETQLPSAEEKLNLYVTGSACFLEAGYTDVGMDHFALPSDELHHAWATGALHRNFMGYTVQHSSLLLGLGMSAISDTGDAYAQNTKSLTDYYRSVTAGQPAVFKGYFLSEEDKVFRRHILDIACKGRTILSPEWAATYETWTAPLLQELEADGLVFRQGTLVQLTERGRPFLRHVCKAFDLHLLRREQAHGKTAGICGKPAFASSL